VGFGGKALTWKVFKFYEKQGVTTLIGHSPYELLMEPMDADDWLKSIENKLQVV
jgi:hypothetical protein